MEGPVGRDGRDRGLLRAAEGNDLVAADDLAGLARAVVGDVSTDGAGTEAGLLEEVQRVAEALAVLGQVVAVGRPVAECVDLGGGALDLAVELAHEEGPERQRGHRAHDDEHDGEQRDDGRHQPGAQAPGPLHGSSLTLRRRLQTAGLST